MTNNNKTNSDAVLDSRRQSFKKILGVGGVIAGSGFATGQWTKPVVNAVLLPAHAQTSGVGSLADPCTVTVECIGEDEIQVNVNGFVEPATPGVAVELDIQFGPGDGTFDPSVTFGSDTTDANGEYTVSGTYETQTLEIRVTATLPDFPEAGDVVCTVHVDDEGPHSADSSSWFCIHA